LINTHALADDRRFADDDAGAVIDEKVRSDVGAGMNVDPRLRTGNVGNQTGNQ
jgi:hypothetical protein